MPAGLPSDLMRALEAGFVLRQQLLRECPAIGRHARRAIEASTRSIGFVAERRDKHQPGKVAWHIRPARPEETPGTIFEV